MTLSDSIPCTLSQKIFREHLGSGTSVLPGEPIGLAIDQCLTQDSTGTLAWLEFESLGLDRVVPQVVVSYVDHTNAAFKGESSDDHLFLQTAASRFGAVFSRPGNGVCHQVHYERFGRPGATLLGSDSHTPTAGGLGMLGIGVGGMDVAVAMAGGLFHLEAPVPVLIALEGRLPWGVNAKDVILGVLRRITVRGGVGRILEYGGAGADTLSVPQRATITNMGAETGATTSIFPSDGVTLDFLRRQGRAEQWRELRADPGASYGETIALDLSRLVPLVAMPGSPDRVERVEAVEGTPLRQVHIGSCTNGGWQDIYVASRLLEGRTISPHCEVMVVPGSRQVLQMAIADGSLGRLVQAGCRIMEPGCGPCIGMGFVPGSGHLSLRSVNRNWLGRGGSSEGRLALASVEVCAASALAGAIADPRRLDPVSIPEPDYLVDDSMLIAPAGHSAEIIRGPNIVPLRPQTPPPAIMELPVLIKLADGISTDDILPAGPLTQHLRSNLPRIADWVFHYLDPSFSERAREAQGGFIAAGENYGQGSSREHAALAPRELGIAAVFAGSFARIHRSNLINCGIAPVVCDTAALQQGDLIRLDLSEVGSGRVHVRHLPSGSEIPARLDLTPREREILLAGGALAYAGRSLG
ncbi:MAG: aconitate hydratase [Bradymonadales bacterium]|nr:aconitate hydratase [Bradymonadales bacterium]